MYRITTGTKAKANPFLASSFYLHIFFSRVIFVAIKNNCVNAALYDAEMRKKRSVYYIYC